MPLAWRSYRVAKGASERERARALKGRGIGLDLRASFPAIVIGLVSEIVKERGAHAEMSETSKMIRNLREWRRKAAHDLGVDVRTVKKGINAMMFGMRLSKWKHRASIPNDKRSLSMERVEREVAKARGLIVDSEKRNNRASNNEKETRALSRAVERIERSIMENLEAHLTLKGWTTSTLIHDEIVIQHHIDSRNQQDIFDSLFRDSKMILRCFEEERGWSPGTIDLNLCKY